MQLSEADREQLLERLKEHAALGHIDLAELEQRVEVVARAETREQALVALGDLPMLGAGDPSPGRVGRARRGHGYAESAQPEWHPTNERFRDPASGKVMRVWVDAAGTRHYVVDDQHD